MTSAKIGAMLVALFLWIDLGRVHEMIPGVGLLKPGLLIQVSLLIMIVANFSHLRFFQPITLWKTGFIASIAPGMAFGYGAGLVWKILRMEIERFLSGFLGVVTFIRTLPDLRLIISNLLYLALVLSLWTIAHVGQGPGMLGDENDIALFLVMLLPFVYMKSTLETSAPKKLFCMGVFLLTLRAIATTLSRGGMVGTLPTLAFIWLKSKRKLLSLVLLVGGLGLTVAFGPEKLLSEFKTIGDTKESTASARLYYWELSYQMYKLHPVFGVGAYCWGNALWSNINSGRLQKTQRISNETPHSVYLQLFSELGTVGTVAWVGLMAAFARTLYQLRETGLNRRMMVALAKSPGAAGMAHTIQLKEQIQATCVAFSICALGFMLSGAFLSVLFYPMLYFFLALAQATRNGWETELALIQASRRSAPRIPSGGAGPAPETAGGNGTPAGNQGKAG